MAEHSLKGKALLLWEIRIAVMAAFIVGLFVYICHPFRWCDPVAAGIMIIALVIEMWYIPSLFRTYRIKFINGAVIIESGVIIKTTHIMPFSKMIYAQSITTPLAKLLGLSAVALKAARSQILIPEMPRDDIEEFLKLLSETRKDEERI